MNVQITKEFLNALKKQKKHLIVRLDRPVPGHCTTAPRAAGQDELSSS